MEKEFDLGILSCFDPTPVEIEKMAEQAQQNMTELYQKMWQIRQTNEFKRNDKPEELQQHDFDRGIFEIDLPEKNFNFPRCKPLPKVKPLTKWQKFAKEKGINSAKKRSKMVYDENSDKWAPRWGAHSIKKNEKKLDWLREVKKGDDIYEDPFHKDALKKKLHKEQLKLSQVKNKLNAQGLNGREVVNQHSNENQKKRSQKTKQIKQKTKKTLSVAQNSTASMGNFDKKAHKEEKKVKTKKRKSIPSFKDGKEEKNRNLDVLNFISGQKKLKQ